MTAVTSPLGPAKRQIVEHLKRTGPAPTQALAATLGVSTTAVRQHLRDLEGQGLVDASTAAPRGRGRPGQIWQLSPLAAELFPDRHDDLTVELIDAVQAALGSEGLDHVIDARADAQLLMLRRFVPEGAPLAERVAALAHQRNAEGYMAESRIQPDGSHQLIEHHCPVEAAARACHGLCRSELELFREALGPDTTVERIEHLLAGGTRCVYRVTQR